MHLQFGVARFFSAVSRLVFFSSILPLPYTAMITLRGWSGLFTCFFHWLLRLARLASVSSAGFSGGGGYSSMVISVSLSPLSVVVDGAGD